MGIKQLFWCPADCLGSAFVEQSTRGTIAESKQTLDQVFRGSHRQRLLLERLMLDAKDLFPSSAPLLTSASIHLDRPRL